MESRSFRFNYIQCGRLIVDIQLDSRTGGKPAEGRLIKRRSLEPPARELISLLINARFLRLAGNGVALKHRARRAQRTRCEFTPARIPVATAPV